jgi:hypoxanthine phosphoribosyltransferase
MNLVAKSEQLRTVISAEQIQKRVREIARQISNDYQGSTIHALAVLENSFMFMADLIRALETPVICQFIKPRYRREKEGLVHSGVTTEFLTSDLRGRGAASVKVATLLDRQSARRVQLQPDYFGFLVDEAFLVGYGLGSPGQTQRNLPYLASAS